MRMANQVVWWEIEKATLARAVALGATVERDRTFLGKEDFWFANVRDPQGISLGLWTQVPGPAG